MLNADSRLSDQHREIFLAGEDVIISAISIAEITIKKPLGKVTLTANVVEVLRSNGIPILSVNEQHAARLEQLLLHHRDPFDRLIIAQAQIEGLTLVTADRQFSSYDVALV
ncbi:PilT protein domain protein [Mesorhizobium sp. SOD10]|nr:PilT protein domain protein [Mesorhizobium sp. SOD10]